MVFVGWLKQHYDLQPTEETLALLSMGSLFQVRDSAHLPACLGPTVPSTPGLAIGDLDHRFESHDIFGKGALGGRLLKKLLK
jgi:hypothetical protein